MGQIIKKIEALHSNDKEQLEVIFSDKNRIIVEAPAGYGKTKTIISRIAYLIASDQVPYPKKILALTFSVNSAYKVKKDIVDNLPLILSDTTTSIINIKEKAFASNYHGFCRRVLKLYGYLIHHKLKDIEALKCIDDNNIRKLLGLNIGLSNADAEKIALFSDAIKRCDTNYLRTHKSIYFDYMTNFFLPNNYISFNAIILLTIELFKRHPHVLSFYQSYFPYIIVDEFQDTNILSWSLLFKLISDNTSLLLIGDPLQRIYGFIGAIPGLMAKAQTMFSMYKVELRNNYRFKDNQLLLLLDKNIRETAKSPRNPTIDRVANINVFEAKDQEEEANLVLKLTEELLSTNNSCKIAILVKQRSENVNIILNCFRANHVPIFYALYSDEDDEYIDFHNQALDAFLNLMASSNMRINKFIISKYFSIVKAIYASRSSEIFASLLTLLGAFLDKITKDYSFLTIEEKIEFIKDTLENRGLKQYMGSIDSNILFSTVHGAKGLEWENIILPDMEQYSFPNYYGLCRACPFSMQCDIDWASIHPGDPFETKFYEELSVFYVAATRALNNVYFTYSTTRINYDNQVTMSKISCFLRLGGIKANIKSFATKK